MTRARLVIQGQCRQPRRWPWPALLCLLWPALVVAQPAYPPSSTQAQQVRIAANERTLWLTVVEEKQSKLLFRQAGGQFSLRGTTSLRVAAMTALDSDLLVFFEDGAAYRYGPDPAPPLADSVLPENEIPLEMIGEQGRVYALIASTAAAELPLASTDQSTPTSQPFDPGDAPLSLAVYDGRSWEAVAPLPEIVKAPANGRLQPRLCLVQDKLLLFTPAEQPDHILYFYRDEKNGQWLSRGTIGVPQLAAFWVVNFSRVPTLVAVSRTGGAQETVRALRLLGDVAEADATAWRQATDLTLSQPPDGITLARYAGAVGFNQHLGLSAVDSSGAGYLIFARIDARPTEQTQPVSDILVRPEALRRDRGMIQTFTFMLLLAVLTGLFVFRRGSMVTLVELPPGCTLALNLQRLLGWLIDFIPFALAAAVTLDIPLGQGLGVLAKWGITPGPEGALPEGRVLLWWGLSACGYTAYALVMELLTRRTVGKVIVGIRLLSEAGTRPVAWQILTRNLTRLIELMPQFWIFVVLVLLSRNRQRMGDIFARTIAMRITPDQSADQEPAAPSDGDELESPDGDSSDD